jgi:hypothetical protein
MTRLMWRQQLWWLFELMKPKVGCIMMGICTMVRLLLIINSLKEPNIRYRQLQRCGNKRWCMLPSMLTTMNRLLWQQLWWIQWLRMLEWLFSMSKFKGRMFRGMVTRLLCMWRMWRWFSLMKFMGRSMLGLIERLRLLIQCIRLQLIILLTMKRLDMWLWLLLTRHRRLLGR